MIIRVAVMSLSLAACAAAPSLRSAPVSSIPAAPILVAPAGETAPAPSVEDAADDPAIWVAPGDGAASLILGTDKQTGLYVYDLSGAEVQRLPVGLLNNVDLRQGGPGPVDLAVASNDGRHVVSVFAIDRATGAVAAAGEHPTGKTEPYGICLGADAEGYDVFATYKDGTVQHFRLAGADAAGMSLVRTIKLETKLEGCVVDEAGRRLFVGEEERGLWSVRLGDADAAPLLVDAVGGASGLAADVEGVSLWRGPGEEGFIVASAQGASRFVVYDRRPPHRPRGVFAIGAATALDVDAVSGTDGLDIVSAPLGPRFPKGILVVQDDVNTDPAANQNFKIIDWRAVEAALGLVD